MHIYHKILPCLLPFLPFATCHQLQQPLISQQPLLRNATLDDADDITSVVIAAFSPTPAWQYIYQFHKSKPNEHHRCVRDGIMQVVAEPEFHIEVIEAPADVKGELNVVAAAAWRPNFSEDAMGVFVSRVASKYRIIALFQMSLFRLWELGRNGKGWADKTKEHCEHRDMNLTRALPFAHASTIALKKYIEEPFGPTQLYLDMIAVHPDYQLHGAGTRLVSRGVERGRRDGVNVTLAALPTSEGFYAHIGWRSWSNFTIEGVDGDREFRYDVMAYDFEGE